MKSFKGLPPAVAAVMLIFIGTAFAVIRIDITAPGRRLPIAVSDFAGPGGDSLAGIIRDDLEFTGLFSPMDGQAFIEPPDKPFNRANWAVTGAEVVVKGSVLRGNTLKVTASVFDLSGGPAMLHKEYEAALELERPLAHSIAGDIYGRLTGEKSVFRTKVAYVVSEKNFKELAVSDWDGMRPRRPGIRATSLLSPHWSPDGDRIIYSALREGRWGIYMTDLKQAKERLLYSSKGVLLTGDFFAHGPNGPNGDEFVFSSSEGGTSKIYRYSLKDGRAKSLTSSMGIDVSPSVSPDGKSIAFVSDRGGSPQVYIMDSDGYNSRRITFEGSYNTSPSWSPSGLSIVFVGRHEGKSQIFTIGADGSDPHGDLALRRLTERGNNEEPSFSPDGRSIAFTSDRAGKKGIYIMRADGEGQRPITAAGVIASGPGWSPN